MGSVFVIIVGVFFLIMAFRPRRYWRPRLSWRYHNAENLEIKDGALWYGRVVGTLAGVFLIAAPFIAGPLSAWHRQEQQQAARQAQQEQTQEEYASLKAEAARVLNAIMRHTPPGQSARSVSVADLPKWLPELDLNNGFPDYDVSSGRSYHATGHLDLTDENAELDNLSGLFEACIIVPDHEIDSSQIASGKYVSSGSCP
jgi:hypothetical protein